MRMTHTTTMHVPYGDLAVGASINQDGVPVVTVTQMGLESNGHRNGLATNLTIPQARTLIVELQQALKEAEFLAITKSTTPSPETVAAFIENMRTMLGPMMRLAEPEVPGSTKEGASIDNPE